MDVPARESYTSIEADGTDAEEATPRTPKTRKRSTRKLFKQCQCLLACASPFLAVALLWELATRPQQAPEKDDSIVYGARGGPYLEPWQDVQGDDPFGQSPEARAEAAKFRGHIKNVERARDNSCLDAPDGSECSDAIKWAMHDGIYAHPDWYGGLTPASSFADFQWDMFRKSAGKCQQPCGDAPPTPAPVDHLPEGKLPTVNKVNGSLPYGHPKKGFTYPKHEGYTLWLVEEFDEPLDLHTDPIWTYSDGGLGEGAVRFIKDGIQFKDGKMQLVMDRGDKPQGDKCSHAEVGIVQHKELTSGEMRTRYNLFRYGIYETRLKTPSVQPGNPWINGNFISTIFAYRDAKFKHWREIDIEILAGRPNDVATNVINGDNQASWAMWFQDDRLTRPWWGVNVRRDFHIYAFEWVPSKITWFVDGKVVRTYTRGKVRIPDMSTKVMMNLWVYVGAKFGGKEIWNNRYPMYAEYDWFRFYKWDGDQEYPCLSMDRKCLTDDDMYLASNNPCDGIPQKGEPWRNICVGTCTMD